MLSICEPLPLSNRELQVLDDVVHGRTNDEIAARLGISHRTVQTHLRNLMAKTGTQNRTQLAVKCLLLRLTPPPSLDDLP